MAAESRGQTEQGGGRPINHASQCPRFSPQLGMPMQFDLRYLTCWHGAIYQVCDAAPIGRA